nr:MAG TPA: hypothetical protein [Caudoviricetes sp.]
MRKQVLQLISNFKLSYIQLFTINICKSRC